MREKTKERRKEERRIGKEDVEFCFGGSQMFSE